MKNNKYRSELSNDEYFLALYRHTDLSDYAYITNIHEFKDEIIGLSIHQYVAKYLDLDIEDIDFLEEAMGKVDQDKRFSVDFNLSTGDILDPIISTYVRLYRNHHHPNYSQSYKNYKEVEVLKRYFSNNNSNFYSDFENKMKKVNDAKRNSFLEAMFSDQNIQLDNSTNGSYITQSSLNIFQNSLTSGSNFSSLANDFNNNNLHTNSDYKYNYRLGNSGNYTYNYSIEGEDEDGNYFEGETDISKTDNYGTAYVNDEDGNEIGLDLEWENYGVLIGTDEDGNEYTFHVDDN